MKERPVNADSAEFEKAMNEFAREKLAEAKLTDAIAPPIASQTQAEVTRLLAALEESVKLQSHYAKLLNMYDGGERKTFASANEWIDRLATLATDKERQ